MKPPTSLVTPARQQLRHTVDDLEVRAERVFNGTATRGVLIAEHLGRDLAGDVTDDAGERAANVVAIALIDEATRETSTWWGTPLGVLVSWWIGHTDPNPPGSHIAAALGISRSMGCRYAANGWTRDNLKRRVRQVHTEVEEAER